MKRELSEQEIIRRESLQKLKELGVNPYPAAKFEASITSNQIQEKYKQDNNLEVVMAGRLMSRRGKKEKIL